MNCLQCGFKSFIYGNKVFIMQDRYKGVFLKAVTESPTQSLSVVIPYGFQSLPSRPPESTEKDMTDTLSLSFTVP